MTEQLSVAVLGANGRMGAEAVKAVDAAADLTLVAALGRNDSLDTLVSSGAQIVVDLTVPESTEANVRFAVEHGMHAVVGTTGWDAGPARGAARNSSPASPASGVLIAPNFALGSVLASAFAAKASQLLRIGRNHRTAPPGQGGRPVRHGRAHRAADLRRARRRRRARQPRRHHHELAGARGCDVDGVRVHSVRLRGLVAHQEVLLGGPGEQLTFRHDSFDRASFMPGVLLGVRNVAAHPGLTVGLDGYLDLGL